MSAKRTVTVDVRAIDVGYQNTKFTYGRKEVDGRLAIAADLFPSLALLVTSGLESDGETAARDDGFRVGLNGCTYFVGKDVANYSSGCEARSLAADYSRTDQYMALTQGAFSYMLADAGLPERLVIQHLTVALPLTTYMEHRVGLRDCMKSEHPVGEHTVQVDSVHVIPQPQGALLHFAANSRSAIDGWVLVIDVGGGTVDWYVANRERPNFERSGAYPKGMVACSKAVVESMKRPDWLDSAELMARVDRAIREGSSSFKADRIEQPVAAHMPAAEAVIEEMFNRLQQKVGTLADIDHIVLTGGGAKAFKRFLARRRRDLQDVTPIDGDPVFCNVKGFHLFGEMKHARAK